MPEFTEHLEEQYTSEVRQRIEKWDSNASVIVGDFASAPDLATDIRGLLYRRAGATGVGDKLLVAQRNALDAMAEQQVPVFGNDILYIRNDAAKTLANDTNAQSPFTAANDTLRLEAGAIYHFDGLINLVQGTTSHTVALTWALTTATLTDISYFTEHVSVTDTTLASNDVDHKFTKVATATVVTPAITATGTFIWITGSMKVNAAGTVVLQITFSADPTGTCECQIGSYLRLVKMPSAAVGPWA